MKLLIDMNLSPRLAPFLAEAGFDAMHWSDVGERGATDEAIDFGAILAATGRVRPGVIQIRSDDLTPERLAPSIINALRLMAEQLQAGALLTIDPARARLRLLPLRPA